MGKGPIVVNWQAAEMILECGDSSPLWPHLKFAANFKSCFLC